MDARLREWCDHQADFWADLITTDTGIRERWRALVERTVPHVRSSRFWQPHIDATCADNPPGPDFLGIPAEIVGDWLAHRRDWDAFAAANPRVEVADSMSDLSERSSGSSWPWSREREIEAWVWEDRPLSMNLIGTPHQQERLRRAAQAAGPGWVYYDLEQSRLVWR